MDDVRMKLFDPPKLTGKYLGGVLSSGWLTTGPMVRRLRDATAEFLGCRPGQVVLAGSATTAFQGVMDLLSHRRPDDRECRVQITEATWPGMRQVIQNTYGCFWPPPNKPNVIVLTDIGGRRLAEGDHARPGYTVIHDACHSWMPDSAYDFGIVSFYPTKLVPGAEGGAVVCKKEDDALELAEWLYCGLVPGRSGRGDFPTVSGRKSNMTDVTAALNLEALELAPAHIEDVTNAWSQMRVEADRLGVPYRDQPVRPYLFQVDLSDHPHWSGRPGLREDVGLTMESLRHRNIPTAWNFRPAPLVTVPCHNGADARVVMEAVAEVLGL